MTCKVKGCVALAAKGSDYCAVHKWRVMIDELLGRAQ